MLSKTVSHADKHRRASADEPYPPIRDYGFIADCHGSALVSKCGSIDWCCLPRIDSASCFGRLIDWQNGGYCRIHPIGSYRVSRRYLPDTLVLETVYTTESGELRMLDCMTMREGGGHNPHRQILRVLQGVSGRLTLEVDVVPVFDYGEVRPWIRMRDGHFIATGSSNGLLISSDQPLEMRHRYHLQGRWEVSSGRQSHLSILWRRPEDLDENRVSPPDAREIERRLQATVHWWEKWARNIRSEGRHAQLMRRSAVVLKGLSHAPTGAIAAAATTSLPEHVGGSRNWDYRYSWIRDSYFTIRALAKLGKRKEADGFRRFVERTAAGSADEVQVLFGVGGERHVGEYELKNAQGYRNSRPVRIGNAAEGQVQLDVYGELLGLAWIWHSQGQSPDDDYWEFLVHLVNHAARRWSEPDQGIWEMRGAPRHFVHSKAMCWSALDRGVRLAEELGRKAPLKDWEKTRDRVRSAIEENGYDRRRGVFVQAFGHPQMDASLLLLPRTGFVDYRDERMLRTTDAVQAELEKDGLLLRYASGNDGMKGSEGTFCCCSFWLAECLAYQGRLARAREIFERALGTGNDLGLYSEEYDPTAGEMLGNFPQALSHLSLVAAAVAMEKTGA
ncbi:MAG: glycoside hydrolase family 15 protein [Hyphomicrobiales bacterium]